MTPQPVVSMAQWLDSRRALLAKEKQFTRLRDELSQERRAQPWVRIDKAYRFDTPEGPRTLAQLFGTRSQLIVYHFMFGPDWAEGCPSCSFWADNFNGIDIHLRHRDIELVAVSRTPLETLQAYRARMGWQFPWVSSLGSDFNFDLHVSFTAEQIQAGAVTYNYEQRRFPSTEAPGISVFARDADGAVYLTYACFARGLDMLNGAYHYMDLTPKGRDEAGLPYTMAWLRRRDRYDPE